MEFLTHTKVNLSNQAVQEKLPDGEDEPVIMLPLEKRLSWKYGKARTLNKDIRLLLISDTHGSLWEKEEELQKASEYPYDICVLLGDHEFDDIDYVLDYIPKEKLYGVLGNHDRDWITKYGIHSLHGKIIEVNGVRILGCGGSSKYKDGVYPSFTQKESKEFFRHMPCADILISHDAGLDKAKIRPCGFHDVAHTGLIGITEYLFRNNVPLHIHGHNHEEYMYKFFNGTTELSLDKCGIATVNGRDFYP